jgi:hypothetical protein
MAKYGHEFIRILTLVEWKISQVDKRPTTYPIAKFPVGKCWLDKCYTIIINPNA